MRMSRALGMISLVVILVTQVGALLASSQAASTGGDAKRFIGIWRLVSDVSTGLMSYDSLGNMVAQVMPNRSRPKYAGVQPTPEEAKEATTGTSRMSARTRWTGAFALSLTIARPASTDRSATMSCGHVCSERAIE